MARRTAPKKAPHVRKRPIRRIGISTGGGDAPGLNAVIRAVALCAHKQGWETFGIRDGYNGIFLKQQYPDGGLIPLTPERVRGITHLGGTIIGTTNAGNPLRYPMRQRDGSVVETDRSDELVAGLALVGADGAGVESADVGQQGGDFAAVHGQPSVPVGSSRAARRAAVWASARVMPPGTERPLPGTA